MSGIQVFFLGLRRSGTTLLFDVFRRDNRFICFDEPFSHAIRSVPAAFGKGTWDQYYKLVEREPEMFWDSIATISWDEELDQDLSASQVDWLRYLLSKGQNVLIDETHLHNKLKSLYQVVPDAHVIHLYRNASAFASSHLIPRDSAANFMHKLKNRVGQEYRKTRFWGADTQFNSWQLESIVGSDPHQKFGLMLERAQIDPRKAFAGGSVSKLLSFWLFHYRQIESMGRELFGQRFYSLSFESFCDNPTRSASEICEFIGIEHEIDRAPRIRPARKAHMAKSSRWIERATLAGFTSQEILDLL